MIGSVGTDRVLTVDGSSGIVVVHDDCYAVLKGIAYLFVMQRAGSVRSYRRQQHVIRDLVDALGRTAPDSLQPHLRTFWDQAEDDPARLRVVVDQVASLTDHSVVSWHQRLCR